MNRLYLSLRQLRNPSALFFFACVVILLFLVVGPIVMLVYGSLIDEFGVGPDTLTLRHYVDAITSPYTYSTLVGSVVFSAGSAVVALVLGTGIAWLLERTNVRFRAAGYAITLVPLVLPAILETIAWIFLLSPNYGYINQALTGLFGLESSPIDVFSMPGMIWIQATSNIPLVVLLMTAAFRAADPALEESAMMSGASMRQLVRRISLPLMVPALASVLLLLIVRGFEAVEVPALIGIPARTFVLTSEIYRAFQDLPPDYGLGSALSVGLLVVTAVGIWLYMRAIRQGERYQTVSGKAFRPRRMDLGRMRFVANVFLIVYGLVVVALPFGVILWASFLPYVAPPSTDSLGLVSLANYATLLGWDAFRSALFNSIVVAIAAATATVLLTSAISWIVYRTRQRGRRVLDVLAFAPIAIPGIVLGMALISQYIALPIGIYGTLWLLLIAYTTKYLPYGMRSVSTSIQQIHRELEEAAASSGAAPLVAFRRIILPLLLPGIAAGWIYICIVSFREFSASVLLAGPDSTVLAVLLFNTFEQGRSTVVAAAGVLMILVLLLIIALFSRISNRSAIVEG